MARDHTILSGLPTHQTAVAVDGPGPVRGADRTRSTAALNKEGVSTVAKGKRTFQPNNRRRSRKHGFRARMSTRAGRAIVSARRRKGRDSVTA